MKYCRPNLSRCVTLAFVGPLIQILISDSSKITFYQHFNVDLDRCRSHTSILNKFCEDNDLFFAVRHSASSVDYTYQFSMNTIDHFILPHMLHSTVDSLSVLHEVDNRSDHDPLFITLNIPVCY